MLNREGRIGKMERMVENNTREKGKEGGWTLNTVMRIHASQIANIL